MKDFDVNWPDGHRTRSGFKAEFLAEVGTKEQRRLAFKITRDDGYEYVTERNLNGKGAFRTSSSWDRTDNDIINDVRLSHEPFRSVQGRLRLSTVFLGEGKKHFAAGIDTSTNCVNNLCKADAIALQEWLDDWLKDVK